MRQLYNDIIYLVQNHVRPVAPSSAAVASPNFLLSSAYNQRRGTIVMSDGTTSSSSLTIAEERPSPPSPKDHSNKNTNGEGGSGRPKLFRVQNMPANYAASGGARAAGV
ncbi:hypothetical protein Cni_G13466 [Canna indica]|uniref:Uncharacterized protein n=1 Tax=Canna indica TaxID=4628 RepID=A0AAQ3KBA6_9LILI|nr:hypothetical protein Cni_G13466 [Canna indica]